MMMTSAQLMRLWLSSRERLIGSLALAACALLCGCAERAPSGLKVQHVTAADFSRSDSRSGRAAATGVRESAGESADSTPALPTTSTAARTASAASAPSSATPSSSSIKPGQPVIIESLIGQVSGRPIFADELLEPIADQLRAEREHLSQADFIRKAKSIVDGRLLVMVRDELFLAESESSLTQQQQQGLLAFLSNFREKTLAESLGSLSRKQQELQQEEGMTVDQFVELERNKLLIGTLINQKINPRVLVSWKDVEREYERRKSEFNPPSTVTLKILRLSNIEKADVIDQLKRRLASGESFDDVMTSLGLEPRTLDPQPIPSGDPGDASNLAEAYRPHLKGLHEGQNTGPFVVGDNTVCIEVAKIDQPPARTLYDVQRELAEELMVRRGDEERARYIKSLFDKGIYSELEEMSRRVLTVALMRYGP